MLPKLNGTETQMVTLYRQGLSVDEIASVLEKPREIVATVIELTCKTQEADDKGGPVKAADLISDEDLKEVVAGILEIAKYEQENPGVRLKAAQFIVEEKMGRNDARVSGGKLPRLNVNVLNQYIAFAKQKAEKILHGDQGRAARLGRGEVIIDVGPEEKLAGTV